MRHILFILSLLALFFGSADAEDLYKVRLHSHADAASLRATGVEPLAWIDGYYLALADGQSAMKLEQSRLDFELIASGVSKDQLVMDGRIDDENAKLYRVVYEAPGVRLLQIDSDMLAAAQQPDGLFPINNEHLKIEYFESRFLSEIALEKPTCLDKLVEAVSQDSLYTYVCSLQAYPYRVAQSTTNLGARNWIVRKFEDFGYTDIELDYFYRYFTTGYNVVAYKPGTVYPERQVIIGAHYDAVLNSPGADDNGSGVAAVLEMARLLKDVELPVTLIFIAFDAEEKGLLGAYSYVDDAIARGDNITFMQNMDMIGAEGNDVLANLFHGPEVGYALLWNHMAQTYSGITGRPAGTSSRSDHYAFQMAGFDVCFSMEYDWSDVYHQPSDSTTHMNFDFMTRMVKACLATVYTAGRSPGVIIPAAIWQPGDGQSLKLHWHPADWPYVDYYRVGYFPADSPADVQHVNIPVADTTVRIDGLVEGQEYGFFVQAIDEYGYVSVPYYRCMYGTPQSVPVMPEGLVALPVVSGIRLFWNANNTEMDLHHFDVFREGQLIGASFDTSYTDLDPSLGTDYHSYTVTAVDTECKSSDPAGPVEMRAATLDENSILAINRSGNHSIDFVAAYETQVFLLEALEGYNYTYYNDTLATKYPFDLPQLDLVDMIDYGVLVIGAESGKYDEIGIDPRYNGILDTLAYYMSIGGKVVMFGRWGDLVTDYQDTDYLVTEFTYDDAYHNTFHIDRRVETPTIWPFPYYLNTINCDLVGAHTTVGEYPELVWDSAMTIVHSNAQYEPVTGTAGIPCASFVDLTPGDAEVIYTYNSRTGAPLAEGKPVAWRYLGPSGQYVWFDIPLSFFERQPAIDALRRALMDVMGDTPTDVTDGDGTGLPGSFALHQNFPNPFNPETTIEYDLAHAAHVKLTVYNLLGQKVRTLVDDYQTVGRKTIVWNGRNDLGETVASGLYLYRLNTDDFTEARKMVMLK